MTYVNRELAEQAKLAKFDEVCDRVFYKGSLMRRQNINKNSQNDEDEASAPALRDLHDWFRTEHGIWIEITRKIIGGDTVWKYEIHKPNENYLDDTYANMYYNEYDLALETSIKDAFKMLLLDNNE